MTFKKLALGALVTAAMIGMQPTAKASILIEPHIAYNLHSSGDNDGSKDTYNGPQYGLKLGYQNLGFMLGLDYTKSSFEVKSEDSGVTSKQKMDRNEIGVFAGYNFPILVRGWVGHYFSNKTEFADGADVKLKGSTTEIGLGFTGLPFLSMNFMYRIVKLDDIKLMGATIPGKFDSKEYVVGISLPLTL